MDLEHTALGKHCAFSSCNQRDFLPFQCDFCKRTLCLAHRTYAAHDCGGADTKDMTSIDCPICGKSVKFAKSQVADEVWNEHYMNGCSQSAQTVKAKPKKCANSSCTVQLGLSNAFNCKKCSKDLCLTHRAAEEHDCLKTSITGGRQAFLDKLQSTATSNPPSKKGKDNKGVKSNSKPAADVSNTLKGTAERRQQQYMQQQTTATSGSTSTSSSSTLYTSTTSPTEDHPLACPFCGDSSYSNATSLQSHIQRDHPDPDSRSASNSSTAARPGTANSRTAYYPAESAVVNDPSSTPSSSYFSGMSMPSLPAMPSFQTSANQSNAADIRGSGPEVCPICQMRFADPILLISHCESAHPSGHAGPSNGGGRSHVSAGSSSNDSTQQCSIH